MNLVSRALVLIRNWIQRIDYGDPEANRINLLLQSASLIAVAGTIVMVINYALIGETYLVRTLFVVLLICSLVIALARAKHLTVAKMVFVFSIYATIGFELFAKNGMRGAGALLISVLIIFASIIFSSRRAYLFYTGLILMLVGFLILSEHQGWLLQMQLEPVSWTLFFAYVILVGFIAIMIRLITENLFLHLARAERNEHDLIQQRERLEQAEARWHSLLLNSPVIIAQVTAEGFIKFVNMEYLGVLANDSKHFIFDFLNPEYRELAQQALKQCFETGQTSKHEVQGARLDGQSAWYEVTVGPVAERGRIDSVILIIADISELKHTEQILRESESRQRALLDAIPELVFRIREDGVLIDYHAPNPAHLLVPPEAFLGKYARDVLPSHVADQLMNGIEQLRQTDKLVEFEYTFDMNKETRFYEARMVSAGLHQVLATVRDVTERKIAEQALRRAEEKYHSIVENAMEGIFQSTPDGQFISVNPAMANMYGYASPEEMISNITNISEQIHADPNTRMLLLEHLKSGTPIRRFEAQERRKDGSLIWTSTNLRAVTDDQGKLAYFEGSVEDITTQKLVSAEHERLVAELETKNAELETKNAELERFSYTVSHDLKSPLITIRGFLGLLEQDALSGKTDLLKGDIARISQATDRMQQLLNELLELSRIGRLMNPAEDWPFESIAHEAVSLVEGRIAKRGIHVSIQFGMPHVYGDHMRLLEVMQNIVENASKFMGDQPQPQIEIGFRGNDTDGKPIFFVRDNGIGIDPRYHERIFGLFNKLDAQGEGTGIGLALVKRIIEVHRGRIWVESEGKNLGTTFCFTLPTAPS